MTKKPIEIIPGIFEKDFKNIERKINLISSLTSWIQIDIADGKFVPNTSFLNPEPFREFTNGKNKFELHMMVEDPFSIVDQWITVGFKRVLFHIESKPKLGIYEIRKLKEQKHIEIGLALDCDTPVESVFPFLDGIDCVLVMTIRAGYSGQKFIPELLEKVNVIRKANPQLPIEVDGGINEKTAKYAIDAGVTRLVSTSFLYNCQNIEEALWKLKH